MTTLQKTEQISPLEKFVVLARDIDQIRQRLEQVTTDQNVDDLLEVIEISELANRYSTTEETVKKRISNAGGKIFKIGKKWVIRKMNFLEVLEKLESEA